MGNLFGSSSHFGGAQDKGATFGLDINHIFSFVTLFGHFVGLTVTQLLGGGEEGTDRRR